jgi:hypothetical protein
VIFIPFTVCSSCRRKFVVCPFVDEETNGSYPFVNGQNGFNGLNGLNGFAHLCIEYTERRQYFHNSVQTNRFSFSSSQRTLEMIEATVCFRHKNCEKYSLKHST